MITQSNQPLLECESIKRKDGQYDIFLRRNIEQHETEDGIYYTAEELQFTQPTPDVDADSAWLDAMPLTERVERAEALLDYVAIMADVELGDE
jgi:hypothetical protein